MSYSLTYEYNSTTESYTVTGCTNTTDNVVVPDTYEGHPVVSIGYRAFYGCANVPSITIGNNVVSIGEAAFYTCTSLVSLKIPSSVTAIGKAAFDTCSNLTKLYIDDLGAWCNITFGDNISFPIVTYDLYLNDELVTNLVIPDGITAMQNYQFCKCKSLISVVIPNSMSKLSWRSFAQCPNLEKVIVGSGVTSIEGNVFNGSNNLKEVVFYSNSAPTLASTNAFPDSLQSIYVPLCLNAIYKSKANWSALSEKIKSNNTYLSLLKFNRKSLEYINKGLSKKLDTLYMHKICIIVSDGDMEVWFYTNIYKSNDNAVTFAELPFPIICSTYNYGGVFYIEAAGSTIPVITGVGYANGTDYKLLERFCTLKSISDTVIEV